MRSHRHSFKRLIATAACVVALALGACGDDSPSGPTFVPITGVAGLVVDAAGAPLDGVAVRAGGVETLSGTGGTYALELTGGDAYVAEFSKVGYLTVWKPLTIAPNSQSRLEVTLMAEAAAIAVDVTGGGEASGPRGAKVVIPDGGLVTRAGAPVTGSVDVHLTPLDPSVPAELAAYPGDLRAETADGDTVLLETFGVMDVTIRQGGEELDVAPGQTLTVSFPAPSGLASPPATAELWSFDEARARWVEEGMSTYDAGTHTFVAELPHLSPWNIDRPLEVSCVRGHVVDSAGAPLGGGYVTARADGVAGMYTGYASADGSFCIYAPLDTDVRITVSHPDGGGRQRIVRSGSTPVSTQGASALAPECPATGCTDAGEFALTQGQFIDDEVGTSTSCSAIDSPFAGTCMEGMAEVLLCFAPEGDCVTRSTSASSTENEWANGSRQVIMLETLGSATGEFYGPSGQLCGTFAGSSTAAFELSNLDGETWRFEDRSGTQVAVCPSGDEVVLNDQQAEAFEACSGRDIDLGGTCEVEQGNLCEEDVECGSGQECCETPSGNYCGAAGSCVEIPHQCDDDDGCEGDDVCCTASGVRVCLAEAQCQAAQGCTDDASCGGSGLVCCDFGFGSAPTCVPDASCPN